MGGPVCVCEVVERGERGAGHRADRAEHALVAALEERLRGRAGGEDAQFVGRGAGEQAIELAQIADCRRRWSGVRRP